LQKPSAMHNKFILLFVVPLVFLAYTNLHAQKDSLVAKNGDVIIGGVKSMDRGVLKMKTAYSDSDFAVDWGEIEKLITQTEFLISTTEGGLHIGNLRSGPDREALVLRAGDTLTRVALEDIVYLRTVKSDFWSRLSASIGLGYNFTKSNNFKQFSVRSTLGYQAVKWSANANYNHITSNRDDVEAVERIDAAATYRYFLRNDWFPLAEVNWLSNTEQNIDLRTVYKLGMGKFLKRTNQWFWGVQAGISYNNETYSDSDLGPQNSAEGFLGTEANLYDLGDLSLMANIIAYPGITESGRWRFDSTVDLQYDLPLDFFVKLGLTVNYDNRSLASDSDYDYVVQTTFGWEL